VLSCTAHGTERYYVAHGTCHRHWFHCEMCHRFVDLGACRVEVLLEDMGRASGVQIRSHTLYATGTCKECLSYSASRTSSSEK
jgi:Fur family ferric uptake transcriptional regulator